MPTRCIASSEETRKLSGYGSRRRKRSGKRRLGKEEASRGTSKVCRHGNDMSIKNSSSRRSNNSKTVKGQRTRHYGRR